MNTTDPHQQRATAILAAHPEVRKLFGYEPRTQYYAYTTVALLAFLAWLVSGSWTLAILGGLTIGPYGMMCALVLMHETCHNLVFKSSVYNRLLGIFTNIPMLFPISEIFRQHHLAHHSHLGHPHLDVDTPFPREIEIVGRSTLAKALWLLFNPIILVVRSIWKLQIRWNRFVVMNWVSCLGVGAMLMYLSPTSFIFLFLSTWMSQGLHPANNRVVQRHVSPAGEDVRLNEPNTFSYYGPMNKFTLNVGFHVEHHDFSRVPQSRLPELHRIAGLAWYPRGPHSHKSRNVLGMWEFITDQRVGLDSWLPPKAHLA